MCQDDEKIPKLTSSLSKALEMRNIGDDVHHQSSLTLWNDGVKSGLNTTRSGYTINQGQSLERVERENSALLRAGWMPVLHDSRKQPTVAQSSTEAEYMAMEKAAKEIIYLWRFLLELGVSDANSIELQVDNMSAQKLAANPAFTRKMYASKG
ncbi:uncharacterized protein LOC122497641 [Leptopilina heterotoma]|uniref:uncharacterized protein LOC122497641 n=1 Tax=Leptopilina heterotoma TaxID=63436 RepID=UPI001CA8F2D2|nr:uncharacterized protein LOC122497641 [Leptopilina heterotoma]